MYSCAYATDSVSACSYAVTKNAIYVFEVYVLLILTSSPVYP